MNYQEWMERTNRGRFKPRSRELRAVDAELRKVPQIKDITKLTALRKALDDWKKSKGPLWRTSVRNHDGAVEELESLINGNASVFNQAAISARMMQARQNNSSVSVNQGVKQKFGPHDPDFANKTFSWDVVFDLVKRGTCIECKVRVAGEIFDETASELKAIPDEEKIAFRTHILAAWNVATVVSKEPGRTRYYDLLFDLEWVERTASVPKYEINVNKLHPDTPNRDNMLNWLFGNREACIHEFGHMIGCPDEYNTIEIQGFGQVIQDPALYNGHGYTTDSIMNNPRSAGRIHDRHFSFVARQCRKVLKTDTSIKIMKRIGPNAMQEVRQLMVAGAHGRRRALGLVD